MPDHMSGFLMAGIEDRQGILSHRFHGEATFCRPTLPDPAMIETNAAELGLQPFDLRLPSLTRRPDALNEQNRLTRTVTLKSESNTLLFQE
jgi:hypothetical protein